MAMASLANPPAAVAPVAPGIEIRALARHPKIARVGLPEVALDRPLSWRIAVVRVAERTVRDATVALAVHRTAEPLVAPLAIVPTPVAVGARAPVERLFGSVLVVANAIADRVPLTAFEAVPVVGPPGPLPVCERNVEAGLVTAPVIFGQDVLSVFWCPKDVGDVKPSLVVVPPCHDVAFRMLKDGVDHLDLVPCSTVCIACVHFADVRVSAWVPRRLVAHVESV